MCIGRRQICKRLGDFDQRQNHYFPQQSPKKHFPKNPETKMIVTVTSGLIGFPIIPRHQTHQIFPLSVVQSVSVTAFSTDCRRKFCSTLFVQPQLELWELMMETWDLTITNGFFFGI